MTTAQESLLSRLGDVPLDDTAEVSDEEYAEFMRRIGADRTAPSVSAFNSSI